MAARQDYALTMSEQPFKGDPSDWPRWLADIALHATGIGGAVLWSSICGDGLTTGTYREAEEAEQQQLVTQLSRATKAIRDLEGVPDLRDEVQRDALYDDDDAMIQALASV